MADQVRMISRTVFVNERVTVFHPGGPDEGVKGIAVEMGDSFSTDLAHARDLDRLKFADPVDRADLEGDLAPPEPHYSVPATAIPPVGTAPAIAAPSGQPVTTAVTPGAANAAVQAPAKPSKPAIAKPVA